MFPHPNEAGFAVVGSEIAYDAAFTTALSAKFTPNASGYYKPQEVDEMLGIGQFVTATVSVEVSKDVFENRLMDIFSGPELKLLAPNVIESGDVSVALVFELRLRGCELLSAIRCGKLLNQGDKLFGNTNRVSRCRLCRREQQIGIDSEPSIKYNIIRKASHNGNGKRHISKCL